jgi:hypothetical protein
MRPHVETFMITKLAGFILIGAIATLAIAGVTGMSDRHQWKRYAHRIEREAYRHSEHARERVERRRDRHRERRIQVEVAEAVEAAEADVRAAEVEVSAAVAEATAAEAEMTAAADVHGVIGTYVFDADGAALGKFPWKARAELELKPAGRFELRVKANLHDDLSEESIFGRYKVRGDRLVLYSPHDDDRFEFVMNGNRLEFDAGFPGKVALKIVGLSDAALVRQQR